jgi:transposase
METTLNRLAEERIAILRELKKNTIGMRHAAAEAQNLGWNAPTIAKHLGVTKRTVYLWNR